MINFKSLLTTLIGGETRPRELDNTTSESTFVEDVDAGHLIPSAQGPIVVPGIDRIEGSLLSLADIDLYQLESERQAFFKFSVAQNPLLSLSSLSSLSLFLFDEQGNGLAAGIGEVGFKFSDNQTFYLGISDGLNPLNSAGEVLLSPYGEVNTGTLTDWQEAGIVLPLFLSYSIAIEIETETVPEPLTSVGQDVA
ncbi:MAG: hypothetical protein RIE73_34365 [Coleofasciculus sp. C1-SOL-03]|jgi:hypothetical protein|uniref:hypothetical protein n=1 Tax=Coleofasciculus sp. C1-SOL-03 TaxID=3069522 RepID=UPI0032F356AD